MHVVIRADGGPKIGYGHLMRTSALASELVEHGHDVTYATTNPTEVKRVCPVDVETTMLPSRDDPEPVREFIEGTADVTVVDSYLAGGEYQSRLGEVAPVVLIADDDRHEIAADVLVNGNLYAAELNYDFTDPDLTRCLGPEYLLLRPSIAEYASKTPPWREEPRRAIITMGGSDTADLTPTIVNAFEGVDVQVAAIVGPGVPESREAHVREVAETVDTRVEVVRDPDDLPERMFDADFAVATSSTTTYELLALGTPIVSVPVVENQRMIADALRTRDLATVIEKTAGERGFREAIETYVEGPDLRRRRYRTGRHLVDGRGATRVYEEVLSASTSSPTT